MTQWTEYGYFLVAEQCKADPIYQSLLAECASAEQAYLAVMQTLSPEARACVERYTSLCEELDNRRAQIAWFCHPQT